MRTEVPAIALVLAAGCGCPQPPERCDAIVLETCVVADPDVRWVPEDIEYGLRAGAAYWQMDISRLRGWTIRLHRLASTCNDIQGPTGCTLRDCDMIDIAPEWEGSCVEMILPHEVGHVAIGDSTHTDSRWTDARLPHECRDGW